jgi:transcription elongation factor Elf1
MDKHIKLYGFVCPNCGHDDKVFDSVKPNGDVRHFKSTTVEMFDRTKVKSGDEVKILEFLYDVCGYCGIEYCYEIRDTFVTVNILGGSQKPRPNIILPNIIPPKNIHEQ